MKFKANIGKQVMAKEGIITFKTEEYETKCDAEIKALENAKGVEKLKAKTKKAEQPKESEPTPDEDRPPE